MGFVKQLKESMMTTSPPVATAKETVQLQGNLGVWSIVFTVTAFAAPLLVVVGLMPSVVAFSGYQIVPAYALISIILLLFAVGYATANRYLPRPGGFYAYVVAGLGKRIGLGGGFMTILGYLGLLLTTWIALGVYARQLVVDTFNGPDIPWYVWSLIGVGITAILGFVHVELSAKVLGIAMLLEVLLVLAFDAFAFASGGPDGIPAGQFVTSGFEGGAFGLALLFGVLCFIGFESAALYREEARDPEKTIPKAIYTSVIVIGVFYVLSAWALLTALGTEGVANAGEANLATLFGETAALYLGSAIPNIINVLVVTSTFACLLASHNALTRYGYSFGKDGVLPASLGRVHPKFNSPYISSTVIAIISAITVVILAAATGFESEGTNAFTVYVRANGVAAIVVVAVVCLVSVAIITFFAKNKFDMQRRAWKTLVAPLLGLIGMLVVFALSIANADSLIGMGPNVSPWLTLVIPAVFLAGVLYAAYLANAKPEVFARIGRQ